MSKHDETEPSKNRKIGGAIDDAKGRIKEAAGALTDDDDLRREGALDRAAGDAKQRLTHAVDQVRDGLGSLLTDKHEEDADTKDRQAS